MHKTKVCEWCNKEFTPPHYVNSVHWALRRFCGNACSRRSFKRDRYVKKKLITPSKRPQ